MNSRKFSIVVTGVVSVVIFSMGYTAGSLPVCHERAETRKLSALLDNALEATAVMKVESDEKSVKLNDSTRKLMAAHAEIEALKRLASIQDGSFQAKLE